MQEDTPTETSPTPPQGAPEGVPAEQGKIMDIEKLAPITRRFPRFLRNGIENWLGLSYFNRAHDAIVADWAAGSQENFFRLACKHLTLNYELDGVENIPTEGPCVVVSNHPHGMSDGLMMGDAVMRVRKDVRFVVNKFLWCVRGMRPYEIVVDVYGGAEAARENLVGLKAMLNWLKKGGCVLVFPSGSAASYSAQDGRVIDDPWSKTIAAIARKAKAKIVPMHISGSTGRLFQWVTRLHKPARVPLLPREIKRDGRTLHRLRIGRPIPQEALTLLPDDEAVTAYMRLCSMLLSYPNIELPHVGDNGAPLRPIAPQEAPADIERELQALPPEALCYEHDNGALKVYAARAEQIPHTMREIAILREQTFREVGEGTGNELDTDEYDAYYLHLIMWDDKAKAIAGAYRMGPTDEIVPTRGPEGVYNFNYFRVHPRLVRMLSEGGLEMGRAIITKQYQRLPASLDTLWMGIGRFLNTHPQYQMLYGTVSISGSYSTAARSLIHSYLLQFSADAENARWIAPKEPADRERLRSEDERLLQTALRGDVRLLSLLVSWLEGEGKGIPVLLKQYLRLGGKMLAFNVDYGFGSTLDCFVVVHLKDTPGRILKRYRGKEAETA